MSSRPAAEEKGSAPVTTTTVLKTIASDTKAAGDNALASKNNGSELGERLSSESKNGTGLMTIFPLLYEILAALSVILLLLVIVMVVLDIVMYGLNEAVQSIKTTRNNFNLIYNDSNEFQLLQYASQYLSEEPYRVYTQKNILNLAMAMVGFAIMVFGFQFGIFLVLKIRAISTGVPYTEDLKMDRIKRSFSILGAVFVGGLILLAIFKTFFAKNYQKRAQTVKTELAKIDKNIYDNMVKDAGFLSALSNHNMHLAMTIVAKYAKNAKSTKNFMELYKLFYTMSVFNYFDSLSPMSSDSRPDVMKLFDVNNLTKKTASPHTLFYFKTNNRVENVFDGKLENDFKAVVSDFSPDEITNIRSNVSNMLDTLNTSLSALKEPGSIKTRFLVFNIMYLAVAASIAFLLYLMFKHYGMLPGKTNITS